MKAKHCKLKETGLKTKLYDEIVTAAKRTSGLTSFNNDNVSCRIKVRDHTIKALRWAEIVKIYGWAAVVLFDWVPQTWILRVSESDFNLELSRLKDKRQWLYETASEYFNSDMLQFLFHTGISLHVFNLIIV